MHDLNPAQLNTVVGGATKNDQITQQITALQTSLKDAISSTTNKGGDNTFMMLAIMIAMRPQQATVVTGGGPPVVAAAAAPGSVVNIRNRVRF